MSIITKEVVDEMLYDLTQEAEMFLWEEYRLDLEIPIEANGRLKRSLGRYISYKDTRTPVRIELSKTILANGYTKSLDVLKHELIHYAYQVMGLPSSDSDKEFQEECKRQGVMATRELNINDLKMKRAVIRCKKCGKKLTRLSSLNKNYKYTHSGCGGELENKGHEVS